MMSLASPVSVKEDLPDDDTPGIRRGSRATDRTVRRRRAGSGRLRPDRGLRDTRAGLTDIVSIRQWLTDAADIRGYVEVRSKFIGHEPTNMLGVIPGLVRPDFLVEIEAIAAVPAR
jgi:hypothetical protein